MKKLICLSFALATAVSVAGCNTPQGQNAAGGAVLGGDAAGASAWLRPVGLRLLRQPRLPRLFLKPPHLPARHRAGRFCVEPSRVMRLWRSR